MMIMVVEATLTVVVAVVSIIAAPFITTFVIVTWWTIGPWNPGDILTVTQVSLLSVSILFGSCEHLADRRWWLPIELSAELIMMAKSLDKGDDNFRLQDVWNTIPDLREMPDVAPKELARLLIDSGQVMLRPWLLTCSLVILIEQPLEVIP